jgi:hypothetical protein
MSNSATSPAYRPPPDHACDVLETPYDLGHDPDTGERHVLMTRLSLYKGKVVDFSLEQTVRVDEVILKVRRVDSSHGVIHVHKFTQEDQDGQRYDLLEVPEHGHDVVDSSCYEQLNKLLDEWNENLRSWRRC